MTTPLREGDQLTPDEFLSRWDSMPDLKRAELIDGVVHMASPLSAIHGDFQIRVSMWLGFYTMFTPRCALCADATWIMSPDSVPQPDLSLRLPSEHSGVWRLQGKYLAGAPELIAEVSHSTFARDSGQKLRLYERSGVREFLIVRPEKKEISWRELVGGKYQKITPEADGILRSRVCPGLWLDPELLWNNDLPGLLALIKQGTATDEHAEFMRWLSR